MRARKAVYIPPWTRFDKERPIGNPKESILVKFDIWVVKRLSFSM